MVQSNKNKPGTKNNTNTLHIPTIHTDGMFELNKAMPLHSGNIHSLRHKIALSCFLVST